MLVKQTSDKKISKYIMLVFFTMPSLWIFRCKLHTCLASQRAGIGHHFLLGLGETCNNKVRRSRFSRSCPSCPLCSAHIPLHKMTLVRLALPIEPPFWRSTVACQLRASCGAPSWESHQRSREGRVSMRSFHILEIVSSSPCSTQPSGKQTWSWTTCYLITLITVPRFSPIGAVDFPADVAAGSLQMEAMDDTDVCPNPCCGHPFGTFSAAMDVPSPKSGRTSTRKQIIFRIRQDTHWTGSKNRPAPA